MYAIVLFSRFNCYGENGENKTAEEIYQFKVIKVSLNKVLFNLVFVPNVDTNGRESKTNAMMST